jgi:glucose/arabinose dehydrogenase
MKSIFSRLRDLRSRAARSSALLVLVLMLMLIKCSSTDEMPPGDPDNGGLFLPDGFEAVVVVDSLKGRARHIAVNDNGDIYVKARFPKEGGNIALRDTTGDGKADMIVQWGDYKADGTYGTAMRIHNGYLYFSSQLVVYRMKLQPGKLVPESEIEEILTDDHPHGSHEHVAKPLTFDKNGNIYVPFGANSNNCQEVNRTPYSRGINPCPILEDHGGIWRFDANRTGQTQRDGHRYATGLRSVVALDWNMQDNNLYALQHGRDDLLRLWPTLFSAWQSAELPSEEFLRIKEGSNAGWPYCYYDQNKKQKLLAPEYGGDGTIVGECDQYENPLIGFPGHWAPNDLLFYQGDQYPYRYKHGAFITFHGSTNRGPYPQAGYFIAFVPFKDGQPSGPWEVFADGFGGVDPIVNVTDAVYRPMGIAMGPDGSLYISDTEKGKIWRIMFKGDKAGFGETQLAQMEKRKLASNVRQPHVENDILQKESLTGGAHIYQVYCGTCHQQNGRGASGRFPPLANTSWVTGDKNLLIGIVLKGMEGPIEVNSEQFNGTMPQHSFLSDEEVATVLTYIRQNFGNEASQVTVADVAAVRKAPD